MACQCRSSLRCIAAFSTHGRKLIVGLHALGGDVKTQTVTQHHDGAHDLQRAFAGVDVAHEGLIDLDAVDFKALQIAERGRTPYRNRREQ